jgi:nucleotide-binding universal stress UspA family protein
MSTKEHTPRSVVVGVEHGTRSDPAIRAGLDLEKAFGARLALVHAIPPPPSIYATVDTTSLTTMARDAEKHARKELDSHVAGVLGAAGDKRKAADLVSYVHGTPARALVDEARERKAEIIVVGPHERHGLLDFTRTLRGVLAHAPSGVWVQKAEPRAIRRVLVPVDLSEPSFDALRTACAMASVWGARVEAVHCFHELPIDGVYPGYIPMASNDTLEDLREATMQAFEKEMARFDWGGIEHEARFVSGDPVSTLLEQQAQADLIVLSTHGRSGLSGMLLGNVAYSVLKEVRTSTLAMRAPMAAARG